MEYFALNSVLILIQDLIIAGLVIFVSLRLSDFSTKSLFIFFLASSLFWSNLSLVSRYPDIPDSLRLFLAQTTYSSSFIFINSMVYFVYHLAGILQQEFKKPVFLAFQFFSLVFIVLSFTDLILVDARVDVPVYKLTFGPMYAVSTVFYILYAIYTFFSAIHAYRKSNDELLKIQMRYILYAAGISSAIMLFINSILVSIIEGAPYFNAGQLSLIVIFLISAYILVKGKLLVLDHHYRILRNQYAVKSEDNLLLLQKLFIALQNDLEKNRKSALSENPDSVKSSVFHGMISNGKKSEPVFDELIHADFIPENSIGLINEKNIIPDVEYFHVSDYEKVIAKNISYLNEYFYSSFTCFSREFYDLILHSMRFSLLDSPVLFYGEVGTGRTSISRAMHYYRGAENLTEIACPGLSLYELTREINSLRECSESGRPGLLLTDIDKLNPEGLLQVEALLLSPPRNKYIYLTSSSSFLMAQEKISRTSQKVFTDIAVKTVPLRERKADIFFEVLNTVLKFNSLQTGYTIEKISRKFMEQAVSYWWIGNSLELDRVVTREILDSKDGILEEFPGAIRDYSFINPEDLTPLERGEKNVIHEYLLKNNYNKNRTKNELGISINTLNSKIEKYGIVVR